MSAWSGYDAKWYSGRPEVLTMLKARFDEERSPESATSFERDHPIAGPGIALGIGIALVINSFHRPRASHGR
jgi:hypothetical protein